MYSKQCLKKIKNINSCCHTYPFSPLICSIKEIRIFQIFEAFLQRRERLIKVNRKTYFCKILSNVIFNHWPKTDTLLFFNRVRQFLTTLNVRMVSSNRSHGRVNIIFRFECIKSIIIWRERWYPKIWPITFERAGWQKVTSVKKCIVFIICFFLRSIYSFIIIFRFTSTCFWE